jgi:acetyltransferase-like isoleucine patch superfamily enzyme
MPARLSEMPLVHETAEMENATLGRYTEIAERCRVSETVLGDYSYMMQDCAVWCAAIGKFANIAASVRINATNHPTWRATLHHFTYRASDYWDDAQHETTSSSGGAATRLRSATTPGSATAPQFFPA